MAFRWKIEIGHVHEIWDSFHKTLDSSSEAKFIRSIERQYGFNDLEGNYGCKENIKNSVPPSIHSHAT
jgi:hypothetical protein